MRRWHCSAFSVANTRLQRRSSGSGVVTDNGNVILDVHGLEILDAIALENAINGIPGVVTVGLFANRGADVALIGTADGVKTIVK